MNNNKFSVTKVFWGLLFIVAAVFLLLDRLNYWPAVYNLSVTKVLFTLFFIWMILEGLRHRNFFCMIFGLAFIAIQYDTVLHITPITPWTLLGAALLISIGLTIIFPTYHGSKGRKYNGFEFVDKGKKIFDTADGETLFFENTFGSSTKYVNTDALVNASFENSFGEMKIYFDNAIIKNGVADINVENSFGAMILYIPKTWNIECHVKTSFAGLKEQGLKQSQGCPTLRIYGEVSFGDITIVYI